MNRSIPTRVLRCVLALALAGTVESSFANYEGSLDSTLNAGGAGVPGLRRYPVDLGGGAPYTDQDTAAAVAVQADGKIVVAGYAWNSVGSIDQSACVLSRYLADGQPDPSFNSGARIVFNFNPVGLENDCYFDSVALQPDGRILVAGHRARNGVENATMFRFNANGSLDSAFAAASPHPGYLVLDDGTAFDKVLVDNDGSIYGIGRGVQLNASDYDFFLHAFDPNGVGTYFRYVAFDRGGDLDDRAATAVLQHIPSGSCGPNCLVTAHTELYLVGSANGVPYPDMSDHDCAVAAFRSDFASNFEFVTDTQFGGSGKISADFPVSGTNEGDNLCRGAVARAGSGAVLGGYGVVIGGENYFISTLGGGTPGLASTYALADVDGAGNVTREDAFAFFQELATPGIYNGVFGMPPAPSSRTMRHAPTCCGASSAPEATSSSRQAEMSAARSPSDASSSSRRRTRACNAGCPRAASSSRCRRCPGGASAMRSNSARTCGQSASFAFTRPAVRAGIRVRCARGGTRCVRKCLRTRRSRRTRGRRTRAGRRPGRVVHRCFRGGAMRRRVPASP